MLTITLKNSSVRKFLDFCIFKENLSNFYEIKSKPGAFANYTTLRCAKITSKLQIKIGEFLDKHFCMSFWAPFKLCSYCGSCALVCCCFFFGTKNSE